MGYQLIESRSFRTGLIENTGTGMNPEPLKLCADDSKSRMGPTYCSLGVQTLARIIERSLRPMPDDAID